MATWATITAPLRGGKDAFRIRKGQYVQFDGLARSKAGQFYFRFFAKAESKGSFQAGFSRQPSPENGKALPGVGVRPETNFLVKTSEQGIVTLMDRNHPQLGSPKLMFFRPVILEGGGPEPEILAKD